MTFAKRHLVRLREQIDYLDNAIATDESRGVMPARKLGLRSALQGVLVAAEEHLQLREEVRVLRAELAELKKDRAAAWDGEHDARVDRDIALRALGMKR